MIRNLTRSLRLWLLPAVAWMATLGTVQAEGLFDGWCGESCGVTSCFSCQSHHCPPPLAHCAEGPPRIRIKIGCPKPICNPCTQPGWGYYETCWSPWPWPPNYNHCPIQPPASTVALSGHPTDNAPYYGNTGYPQQQPVPQTRPLPPMNNPPLQPQMPVRTTPVMPMPIPSPLPNPGNIGPMPGGGIESLPVPRPDNLRPMPNNPGGF